MTYLLVETHYLIHHCFICAEGDGSFPALAQPLKLRSYRLCILLFPGLIILIPFEASPTWGGGTTKAPAAP